MEFKPTKTKLIVSILAGILINFLYRYYDITTNWLMPDGCGNCGGWVIENLFKTIFSFSGLAFIVLAIIIIYAIWSLVQKK